MSHRRQDNKDSAVTEAAAEASEEIPQPQTVASDKINERESVTQPDPLKGRKMSTPAAAKSVVTPMNTARDTMVRDTLTQVHKSSMSGDVKIREAAVQSLEIIVTDCPLLYLQTWLDQFARTNGGSSATEYAASNRIYLLQNLERVMAVIMAGKLLDDNNVAHRACIGRIISMATEEMTRHSDIISDVQNPCSVVLVKLGASYIERVMDSILSKFPTGTLPHFYVIATLTNLAQTNSAGSVPYLKAIMSTMVATMKLVKKDALRAAFADAFARFSESIYDYLANPEEVLDPSVDKESFSKEIDQAHETLFTSWLPKGDQKLKHSIFAALGLMSGLQSEERLYKHSVQVATVLISNYKRTPEPYHVTDSLSQLIDAVVGHNPAILEPVVMQLLTALFLQIEQGSADFSKPLAMKNHNEVLRCYTVLIKSHKEQLIVGLILRMGSVEDNIRLAALTILKHLMSSSLSEFEDRMSTDVFKALHGKLGESSNKVRKMLAQITAQLGRLGYLKDQPGRDFLEFLLRLCALTPDAPLTTGGKPESHSTSSNEIVTNSNLREMCDSILQLLANSVPCMEAVLWPHMLDYSLIPEYTLAIPAIIKSSANLAAKKKLEIQDSDYEFSYGDFQYIRGPYVLFARLIVLAAVPFFENRGSHVLTFLQEFAPNISKHIPGLWMNRIPLLQHYLDTHVSSGKANPSWDQRQWEEWLLDLVEKTVAEIGVDAWTSELAVSMCEQLDLYGKDQRQEKCFLTRALGKVLKLCGNKQLVSEKLTVIFQSTVHQEKAQQHACAKAFGTCAGRHLNLVLDKLEILLKGSVQKKSNSFFAFLNDSKAEQEKIRMRTTILFCVGQAAASAPKLDLKSKLNEISQKFIMPDLKSANTELKVAALRAMADVARAVQPGHLDPGTEVHLAQHGDLIHEAIECLRDSKWTIANKQFALVTILELIQIPPFISQLTRNSLLKACFAALFPVLATHTQTKEEEESISHRPRGENQLEKMVETLLNLVKTLLRQELLQATLDEIFTLLEPRLKQDFDLARDIASAILLAMLQTYVEDIQFKVGDPSAFNPGPYIIGAVIPRCFDPCRSVQTKSLQSLQIVVTILSTYEGHAKANIEEKLSKLKALSAMSPTTNQGGTSEPIQSSVVASTVAAILNERILPAHLLPLLHALIDGLLDVCGSGACGSSIIFSSLVEHRGSELYAHSSELVAVKLHSKLCHMAGETRIRTLTAVRVLTSFNHREVVDSLLVKHSLPLDDSLESIWTELAQDSSLALKVMKHLLEMISSGSGSAQNPCVQDGRERLTNRPLLKAKHNPLAAIVALKNMFSVREMESVFDGEFAAVFVPLLASMASYIGVKESEPIQPGMARRPSLADQMQNGERSGGDGHSIKKTTSPFMNTKAALESFLNCKGCSSIALIVEQYNCDLGFSDNPEDVDSFSQLIFEVVESLIQDFPQFLSKLMAALQGMLGSHLIGHRLIALAFNAQLVQSRTARDTSLIESAMDNLLSMINGENPGVENNDEEHPEDGDVIDEQLVNEIHLKIICLNSLASFNHIDRCNDRNFGASILSAFLAVIGEDFKTNINHIALKGLCNVLDSSSPIQSEDVHRVMSEIANKVRPFLDCGKHRDSAEAMRCFAQLSNYAVDSYKEVYTEHIHLVLISLLLHANDDLKELSEASRTSLLKILPILFSNCSGEDNCSPLLDPDSSSKGFDYSLFLRNLACFMAADPGLSSTFPVNINTTMTYFSSPSANLRCNAVRLLASWIMASDVGMLKELDDNATETVLKNLGSLLSDKSILVQETSAENIGKVFIHLRQRESDGGGK